MSAFFTLFILSLGAVGSVYVFHVSTVGLEYLDLGTLPPQLTLNVLAALGFWCLIHALSGRIFLSVILATVAVGALAYGNHLKIRLLGEPLLPFDALKLGTASMVIPSLLKDVSTLSIAVILGTFVAVIGFAQRALRKPYKSPNQADLTPKWYAAIWQSKIYQRCLCLALGVSCLKFTAHVANSDESPEAWIAKPPFLTWDPLGNTSTNGFLLNAFQYFPMLQLDIPTAWLNEEIESTLMEYLESESTVKAERAAVKVSPTKAHTAGDEARPAPHVLVIMVESWWDPLKAKLRLTADPTPRLRALGKEGHTFKLISPVYGGGTANAEFEMLTGLSHAFFPPGSIAYQQYVKAPVESLASQFKLHGYKSIVAHPNHASFWSRNQVYPHLGFDTFRHEGALPAPTRSIAPSDESLFAALLEELRAAQDDQPAFLFGITISTHYPYFLEALNDLRVRAKNDTLTLGHAELIAHADRLARTDEELGRFLLELDGFDRDVLLVVFGDHHPPYTKTYLENRTDSNDIPLTRLVNATVALKPAGIDTSWENPLVETGGALIQRASDQALPMFCLAPLILRMAGIQLLPRFAFIQHYCVGAPALSPGLNAVPSDPTTERFQHLTFQSLFKH